MRLLYKIYSAYDGFRPAKLHDRLQDGRLRLGWRHYIDVVEKGWECWVYFHGPQRFVNGVYAKGIVDGIDSDAKEVSLRVRKFSTDAPITSRSISEKIAKAVSTRGRQVFLWPDDLIESPQCDLKACAERRCGDCIAWTGMPLIGEGESTLPKRLRWSTCLAVLAAHWIIPRRCYESRIVPEVRKLTRRFTEFKLGEMTYAYPFALSMFEQLRRRNLLDFDYVVPIPLSPDKAKSGEKHRTRALVKELGGLLAANVNEMLSLSAGISKRRMIAAGATTAQFERKYRETLQAKIPVDARRVLLVDDVMTRGSTIAQALHVLQEQCPEMEIVVATAGQMIVKEAVLDSGGFKNE